MSTSVAASASNNHLSSDSRAGPLRRLSQLRAYTQHYFSPQHSSSPSTSYSSNNGHRLSRRHTLSNRVSWLYPASTSPESSHASTVETSNNPAPCPEPEQSTLARYSSAIFPSYRGLEIELRSQTHHNHSESSTSIPSNESGGNLTQGTMARLRGATHTPDNQGDLEGSTPSGAANPSALGLETPDAVTTENSSASLMPRQKATIRFFPHQDSHQNSRPSLPFIPISRTLPSESSIIRVGRYSERDGLPVPNPTEPSDSPVGFKSKVVSRRHCEFLYENGQWHVKDVGSSSGTFLNHMRLSQPNMVSRLYTIKDGDIVQLGIDFRGGEEMIFRCVRIRIECNRSWQRQPNEFNKNTESLIKNLGKGDSPDYSGCRECSICLGSVLRPYQCLFMAACAHVWHYKCVSRLIHTPDYPMFQCPNCRAYTDLSAEVDDTNDFEENEEKPAETEEQKKGPSEEPQTQTRSSPIRSNHVANTSISSNEHQMDSLPSEAGLAANIENMQLHDFDAPREAAADAPHSTPHSASPSLAASSNDTTTAPSASIDIPGWQSLGQSSGTLLCRQAQLRSDTPGRSESSDDNPLTPRNDSGPLALDGRASMS